IYASNLAAVLRELGRREESVSCCLRALELHRAQGSRADEAIAHGNLATVQRELGLLQEAELSFRRALHILRDHENRIMEGLFLVNMGNLLDDTGRTVHAIDCYEHAIMWFRRGGVRGQLGLALGNLGVARKKLGRLDDGLAALTEAIQLLEAHKSLHFAGAFAALRGEFRLLLGDVDGAKADLALAEKLLPVPNALVLHRRHVLPLRARLLAHEGKAPELRALVDAFRADVGNVAPASEDGEELHRLTALVEGLQAGTLFNGHTTSEMTRELRRALVQREGQPEPLRERLLAAGV
ncbi:MAG: tetratricopeptide repeat protein, partial [Planctomycetes bacterium]|nr:tetratricopeptide repeat protein [Planctomycetota bacterium]